MSPILMAVQNFGAACSGGSLLGLPKWYEYLDGIADPTTGGCIIKVTGVNDVWLIVAAVIEILIRVAGLMAVIFVMYGGFRYITSQAEPDAVNKARQTIISALIGLAIAILAGVTVDFIARRIN